MNLEKWIRPVVVALLFGAFLTGQSRYAMAEETEAETAPPPAVMSAGNPEEKKYGRARGAGDGNGNGKGD